MISIKKGSNRISFEGTSKREAVLFDNKETKFLTGETYKTYRSKVVVLEVNVEKLTDSDYDKLEVMLFDETTTEKFTINSEKGKIFYMIFEGDRLGLSEFTDDEKNIFWTGTLKFTQ